MTIFPNLLTLIFLGEICARFCLLPASAGGKDARDDCCCLVIEREKEKEKRSLHNPFWKLKTKNLDNIPKFRVVVVVEDIPERDTNDDERPVSTLNLDK